MSTNTKSKQYIYIEEEKNLHIVNCNITHTLNEPIKVIIEYISHQSEFILKMNKTYTLNIDNIKYKNLMVYDVMLSRDIYQKNIHKIILYNENYHKILESNMYLFDYKLQTKDIISKILDGVPHTCTLPNEMPSNVYIINNIERQIALRNLANMLIGCFISTIDGKIILKQYDTFYKESKDINIKSLDIKTYEQNIGYKYGYSQYNVFQPNKTTHINIQKDVRIINNIYDNKTQKPQAESLIKSINADHKQYLKTITGQFFEGYTNVNLFDKITYENDIFYIVHIEKNIDIQHNQDTFIAISYRPIYMNKPWITKNFNMEIDNHTELLRAHVSGKDNNTFIESETGYMFVSFVDDIKKKSIPLPLMQHIANNDIGQISYPSPNTEVIVGFIGDNIKQPIIIGSNYTSKNKVSALLNNKNNSNIHGTVYDFHKSKDKSIFNYHDVKKGESKSQYQNNNLKIMGNQNITIQKDCNCNAKKITIKAEDITIDCKSLDIKSQNNINLKAQNINIEAKQKLNIKSNTTKIKTTGSMNVDSISAVTIKGMKCEFEAKTNFKIKGLMITSDAKVSNKIQGTIVDIKSKGMMKLTSNGILMIKAKLAIFDIKLLVIKSSLLLNNAITIFAKAGICPQGVYKTGIPF